MDAYSNNFKKTVLFALSHLGTSLHIVTTSQIGRGFSRTSETLQKRLK